MEEQSVSDSVHHCRPPYVSFAPPFIVRGGHQYRPQFSLENVCHSDAGRNCTEAFTLRIHRKHTPALTPWMLKGGKMLLMFFVCFVSLFGIFCSESCIYINVTMTNLY